MTDLNHGPVKGGSQPDLPCVARRRGDSGFVAPWKNLEELVAQTPQEAIRFTEWESMPMLEHEWPVWLPER